MAIERLHVITAPAPSAILLEGVDAVVAAGAPLLVLDVARDRQAPEDLGEEGRGEAQVLGDLRVRGAGVLGHVGDGVHGVALFAA